MRRPAPWLAGAYSSSANSCNGAQTGNVGLKTRTNLFRVKPAAHERICASDEGSCSQINESP
jgi:hypothetical protein